MPSESSLQQAWQQVIDGVRDALPPQPYPPREPEEESLDDWLNEAASQCAHECNLSPTLLYTTTDYAEEWGVEYRGCLTLGEVVKIARFMQRRGPEVGPWCATITDQSGRIGPLFADELAVLANSQVFEKTPSPDSQGTRFDILLKPTL